MAVETLRAPAADEQQVVPDHRPPSKFRKAIPQYVAISPFFILFAVFGVFPVLFSIYISFFNWNGIGAMNFVGLEQYRYLFTDPMFWTAISNTLIIWVLSTIPMLLLALVVANALHNAVRFRGFYRVAYFIPNVTSLVAMTLVFGSIFSNNFGLLNAFVEWAGLTKVEWLTSPTGIKIAIAAIIVWRWMGYNAIIFLAGLQAISSDIYEAAKVDGASSWQTFWRITVPLMRPVILFTVIMSTIGGMQVFTESQVLLGDSGGPGNAGITIVSYLYYKAFSVDTQFGYGAAIGWALFILIALFSIINWRLVGSRSPEELVKRGKGK
jgi:cellobiose transport system permease protein